MRAGGVFDRDLNASLYDTVKRRFPWLVINLATAGLAAMVVSLFKGSIQHYVTLAVLMPIIASMGGNAGIQSVTVAVRSIARRELQRSNALPVIRKEMLAGLASGLGMSLIMFIFIVTIYGDVKLGLIFALATTLTLTAAGLSGAVIPLLLSAIKVDPAISAGVHPHHRNGRGELLHLSRTGDLAARLGFVAGDKADIFQQVNAACFMILKGAGRGEQPGGAVGALEFAVHIGSVFDGKRFVHDGAFHVAAGEKLHFTRFDKPFDPAVNQRHLGLDIPRHAAVAADDDLLGLDIAFDAPINIQRAVAVKIAQDAEIRREKRGSGFLSVLRG